MRYAVILGSLLALSSAVWPATALAESCANCVGYEECRRCARMQAGEPVVVPGPSPSSDYGIYREPIRRPTVGLGARGHVGGAFFTDEDSIGDSDLVLYGVGGALRLIPHSNFGFEITGDYTWTDTEDQWQVPVQLSALFIFNPDSYVQPILILGIDYTASQPWFLNDVLSYMGGHVGIGLEFMANSHVGLMVDLRYAVQGLLNDKRDFPNVDRLWGIDQRVVGSLGINFYL